MIVIEYAKEPVRISPTKINLVVKFSHFNEELPFTACENDIEIHGRELYQLAVNGEFGPIG